MRPRFTKQTTEHIPARRSNQGARAPLDRESAPSKCERATSRHENLPHLDNVRGLAVQQITEGFESIPPYPVTVAELLNDGFTENLFFAESIS